MPGRVDTASRLIAASSSEIYQAFATADALQTWLPPDGMTGKVLAFDFRRGGSYRMRLTYPGSRHGLGKSSRDSDEVEVRFVELVPGERVEEAVSFESADAAYSGEMRVTWTLESTPNGTLVTVRCADVPVGIREEDHRVGLTSTLGKLAAFVEARR